jgi:tetratricopeptide (TPR) repeat protein
MGMSMASDRSDMEASRQYQHCITTARSSPNEGWQEALAWSSLGGGEAARHCAAVAMVGMRQFEDAAVKFEELSANSDQPATIRAGMLAQAGQSWLLAKQPENAFRVQSKALELVPNAPDLLVDRAQSQAAMKDYDGALKDLDAALLVAPNRADTLTFRATAKRYLHDLEGAKADIEQALQRDDKAEIAWLEDGIEKTLADDLSGARLSFEKVLALAPQSEAADLARRNLESLGPATP